MGIEGAILLDLISFKIPFCPSDRFCIPPIQGVAGSGRSRVGHLGVTAIWNSLFWDSAVSAVYIELHEKTAGKHQLAIGCCYYIVVCVG